MRPAKVEQANRSANAVAVGNPREFTRTEKEEQEIAEACNRLTGNNTICWNYRYMARRLERSPDSEARNNLLSMIAARSPLSWSHINMLGEYHFFDEKLHDSPGFLPLKPVA